MAYEIDFIGVGEKVKKDADAICLRWKSKDGNGNDVYKIAVYDGGFDEHGEEMIKHMNRYYFGDPDNKRRSVDKKIDFVVVSHPDQDHATGVKLILENFEVGKLVMNRPWLYASELYDKVKDGRATEESLEKSLREKYETIAQLEEIAMRKGVPIVEAFQGMELSDGIVICSPSKQFYLDLLVESEKTSLVEKTKNNFLIERLKNIRERIFSLVESWDIELLKGEVETSAENETSVVVRGIIDGSGFLLCGDAGVRALTLAMDYLDGLGEDVKTSVSFFEIPHHGSRHNVTPSVLDRMIGERVERGKVGNCTAFASVAKGSDHPLRMVTNAYKRRGVKVCKTAGGTTRHHVGNMPSRGWGIAEEVEFYDEVEEWND